MSQKIPGDSGQKGFAVGRGLLAAAETLNFSMGDPGSGGMYGPASRPVGGMPRGGPGGGGLGAGGGGGLGQGPKDPQHDPQLSRRVGSHLGSTMKLFASLGLSPADLDELAQIPEDSISVETLPTLIMQLKNRKMDTGAGRRISDPHRDMSSALSQETSYRPGRDSWADMQDSHHHHHHHHLESSPMGHGSGRGNVAQSDFGYGSMQDMPPPLGGVGGGGGGGGGGYDSIDYGHGSGGGASIGGRERQYSELSHDSYRGLGMGTSMSMSTPDSMLMQRRMGSPSHGKVQDFMGAMPHMFPHVCSLCDFDVHSTMEWNQHTNGLRHSENCRLLLQMYPEWDPHMPSNRGAGLHSMDPSGRSDGLLGAAPQGGGMGSNWGSDTGGYGGYSNKQQTLAQHGKVRRGRVIVVKYDRKPQPTNSLFALAKPFGTVRENLVLKKKAFLELETHEEAKAMADFYQRKPAMVNGKEVQLYLSREIAVIDKTLQSDPLEQKGDRRSQVVFFSNLRRDMNKSQLLSVCQQFGTVEKHLFLAGEAFVQMKTPNDAEMLVKYYTLNPLSIKGKNIRLNICTKYKTLTVHQGRAGQGKQDGKGNNSGSKASSTRGQRSSSSRAKDASSDKADTSQDKNKEMEEEDEEEGAQGEEGSGDEVAGVMEGDEQEEEEEGGDEEQGDDEEDMEQDGAEESAEQQEANKADPEENAEEGGDANTCSAEVQGDGDEKGQEQSQEEEKGDGEEDQKEKEAASSQDEAAMEETAGADQEASTEAAKDPEAEEGPQDDSLPDDPSEDQCGEPDFPENMDDFVTLDELAEEEDGDRHDSKSRGRDSSGSSRKSGGLRVVNVVGFRRGINYLDEILSLAKPFGKVVRHLVLNVRPEAFLELSTEQEARSMVSFYNSNVTPSVCGKAVKIYHSQTYATIQSGKVIYVGQIPYFKTSDATLLKIAEPFGKIRRYYMNRSRNECFIEMENGEDAESMADAYKTNPPKFQGKRLTVYMSRKYKQLKHGHRPPSPEPEEKRAPKRERTTDEGKSSTSDSPSKPSSTTSSTTSSAAKKDEQQPPPAKKAKEDKKEAEQPQQQTPDETPTSETTQPPATGEATTNGVELKKETAESDVTPPDSAADQKTKIEEDVKQEELEPPVKSASVDAPKPEEATPSEAAEKRPEVTQLPLDPHDPSTPIGVEFVKMGYYCRVCFLFYSNEETAKKVHCSSKGHYEKLKKHLEKEKAKSQSSNSKN